MTTPTPRVRVPDLLSDQHPFRQWKTFTIPGTSLTLTGYSRANDKTFFELPQLRCCIDAGLCEGRRPESILLTHTHDDHVADLDFMVGRPGGVDLYAPSAAVPYIERYIRSRRELNLGEPFDPARAAPLRIHPVGDGDTFHVGKRGHYQVRVVECIHKVPCVGYCFSELHSQLRPELASERAKAEAAGQLAQFGQRMAALRREGAQLEEQRACPRFAVLGDTHPRVFERSPWLFEYPVIITECTYLLERERERAERVGHTVWSELRPVVRAHPEITFVLIHFSLRHSDAEVVEFFEEQLAAPDMPDNIVVWASPSSLLPEQHQAGATRP